MSSIYTRMTIEELEVTFKKDPNRAIQHIYAKYRSSFMAFLRSYTNDDELLIDCFQDSVIILYENLSSGAILKKETALKTYLYAIGKNKILKTIGRKKIPTTTLSPIIEMKLAASDQKEITTYKEQMTVAFDQLGEKCKAVIIRFYYQKQSIQEIASALNYKNENTVKAHKSRCIAKLKEMANQVTPAL